MNIPVTKAVGSSGLNDNIQVGITTIHVQTEDVVAIHTLVTSVIVEGAVIHQVKRDYKEHLYKPNFSKNLPKVAQAQQSSTVQKAKEIWLANKAKEVAPALAKRTARLFDLGLRAYRTAPSVAVLIWQEVLEIDSNHRQARANLNRLLSL